MLRSIYVIGSMSNTYKIGISKTPRGRLSTFNTGSPNCMKLIFESQKIYNASKIEAQLHNRYCKHRIRGEWFNISNINELIETINELVSCCGETQEPRKEKTVDWFHKERLSLIDERQKIEREIAQMEQENKNAYDFAIYLQHGLGNDSLYADTIYKYLFGKPFKELQQEYGIKPKESLRDYLTSEQLREVESAEMLVSSLINVGWGYEQIKQFLEANKIKQLVG